MDVLDLKKYQTFDTSKTHFINDLNDVDLIQKKNSDVIKIITTNLYFSSAKAMPMSL